MGGIGGDGGFRWIRVFGALMVRLLEIFRPPWFPYQGILDAGGRTEETPCAVVDSVVEVTAREERRLGGDLHRASS